MVEQGAAGVDWISYTWTTRELICVAEEIEPTDAFPVITLPIGCTYVYLGEQFSAFAYSRNKQDLSFQVH